MNYLIKMQWPTETLISVILSITKNSLKRWDPEFCFQYHWRSWWRWWWRQWWWWWCRWWMWCCCVYVEVISTVPVCSDSVVPAGLSSHPQDASRRGTEHIETAKVSNNQLTTLTWSRSFIAWTFGQSVLGCVVWAVGPVWRRAWELRCQHRRPLLRSVLAGPG